MLGRCLPVRGGGMGILLKPNRAEYERGGSKPHYGPRASEMERTAFDACMWTLSGHLFLCKPV